MTPPRIVPYCTIPGLFHDATAGDEDGELHIYTPSGAVPVDGLPVLAFIHGGRFEEGSPADINGTALAREGFVVVSIGYRLGLAGFAQFHDDNPAHYRGIADVQLALEWLQHNIEGHGGDPTNITLIGQSAGAAIALWLARRDHYRGAFRRLVALSPSFPTGGFPRSTHHAGFFEPVWGLWPRSWTRQPERCPFAASLPAFSLGVLRRSGARTVAVGHQRTRRRAHLGHQHTRRIPQRTHHLRTRPLETRRGCRMGAAGVRSWAWGIWCIWGEAVYR